MQKYLIFPLILYLLTPLLASCQAEVIKSNNDKEQVFKSSQAFNDQKIRRADNPKKKEVKKDSIFINGIGEERVAVIKNSETATVYKVEPFITRDSSSQYFEDYKILQSAVLEKEAFNLIKNMLLSSKTYTADDKYKLCLFLPKMGITFKDSLNTSNVLVALDCDMTRIYLGENYIILNSDPGHDELISFFKNVFPEKKNEKKIEKSPIIYTVESGDGWNIIAKKTSNTYKVPVTIEDILAWNEKTRKDIIHPGDKIIVGYATN